MGHYDIVELLGNAGASVEAPHAPWIDPPGPASPLQVATEEGHAKGTHLFDKSLI